MRIESAIRESYEEDGETAILLDDQVLVISPLAAAIVSMAADGVDVVDLHEALIERFGVPPTDDPLQTTRAIVADLVQTGMLREAS
jgi:hypothetical protein